MTLTLTLTPIFPGCTVRLTILAPEGKPSHLRRCTIPPGTPPQGLAQPNPLARLYICAGEGMGTQRRKKAQYLTHHRRVQECWGCDSLLHPGLPGEK